MAERQSQKTRYRHDRLARCRSYSRFSRGICPARGQGSGEPDFLTKIGRGGSPNRLQAIEVNRPYLDMTNLKTHRIIAAWLTSPLGTPAICIAMRRTVHRSLRLLMTRPPRTK